MRCWGCRKRLKDGAWFFTDAPPGRKIGLCDDCHKDSAPSKHRREWQELKPRVSSFRGAMYTPSGLVNSKSPG